jgi:LysM repeat protein
VIAKSDLFILVVSASLLAVGIYRWQHNLSVISANAQQAQVQRFVPARNATQVNAISSTNGLIQSTIPAVSSVQTSIPVAVSTPSSTSNIVVAPAVASVITNPTQNSLPLFGSYIVVSGDYLLRIALRYGTTVQTLQDINNINGTLIEVGQEIQFPLPAN